MPTPAPPDKGNPTDPAYVRQWVDYYAQQPGANPSTLRDPDYWVRRILETGGWQGDNAGYWSGPQGMFRVEGAPEGGGRPTTTTTTPTTMTYEQALQRANEVAQQYLGRSLTPTEIQGYIQRFGGGPGTTATQASLSPVLADIMAKAHTGTTGTTPPPTRAPFVPLDTKLSGSYDDAVKIIQERAQQYLGRQLTPAELDDIKKRYANIGTSTPDVQGTLLKATRRDPNESGTADQALAYLNSESQRLRGTALSPDEITKAQQLINYQPGARVTGAQVNTLLDQLDTLASNRGPGTPGTHTYTGSDINPILQELYNKGGQSNTGGPGGPTPNPDPYGLASYLTSSPLLQPWTRQFQADKWTPPTSVDEANDPGVAFRAQQGQQAIERAAAAKGTLLTGGTLKDLMQFGQDYGSNEYGNVYARAQNNWQTNYNKAQNEYTQAYNIFENNQAKQYNRIANLAGLGQTAAGQLGQGGLGSANIGAGLTNYQNANLGNLYTGIGNAQAGGIIGGANAWSNALGNIYNNSTSLYGTYLANHPQ